jgi:hypothetical protein
MSIKDLRKELEVWGKASRLATNPWKDILDPAESKTLSKRIFKALQDDMDSAIRAEIPGAEQLRFARDAYKADSEIISSMENTALGKFFASNGIKNGDDLEKTIVSMANGNQAKLKETMSFIEKEMPEVHDRMRAFWLERFLVKARSNKADNITRFNPDKFLDMVTGDNAKSFEAIFDGDSINTVKKAIEATRRIIINNKTIHGNAFMVNMKSAAGIAASLDPTFAARFAAELFTPGFFSRFADNKTAVKALETLAGPYNTNRWATAVAVLAREAGFMPMTREELESAGYTFDEEGNISNSFSQKPPSNIEVPIGIN